MTYSVFGRTLNLTISPPTYWHCSNHAVFNCSIIEDRNNQTWSSRDLSLGLETCRDSFLQVLVSVLVLEPSSLGLGLGLGLGTSESWSWSWSWNRRVSVSVLVLEPQSLGLGVGLGSLESRSRSWSWDLGQWRIQTAASIAKKSTVCLLPLLLWNGYLATVVSWGGQIWLEWVATFCHSWSTCDATISCKFSCCCTVVIRLQLYDQKHLDINTLPVDETSYFWNVVCTRQSLIHCND